MKILTEENHVCELLMEYALSIGVKRINELPGLWEHKIDDTWEVKCNGHNKTIGSVPPYSWSISYNGWPAGIMSITGEGILCAGEGGNEENLKEAILKKLNP